MTHMLRPLWDLVRNPPLVWEAPGEPDEIEQVTRRERWHMTRSTKWLTAFTRHLDCGCRKRLGRHTLYCSDCVLAMFEEDDK